jgi:hypothetical protein
MTFIWSTSNSRFAFPRSCQEAVIGEFDIFGHSLAAVNEGRSIYQSL